uniref:Uncharacterized protein n=1 Tax=Periophthalmus magnuspinnatus TaxID=409849 RepID=A0A3B4AUT7_9GOBI
MADRAEMFSLSTFHSLSPPGCRPAHDISLEEFDDEDLSEITDDCGIGLNYDSDPYEKDSLILEKNDLHHPVCSFQDDFQEFEMIDDEDEEEEDDDDEEVDPDAPPSPSASPPPSPTFGTLKSRPTTLNLTTAVSQDNRSSYVEFPPIEPPQPESFSTYLSSKVVDISYSSVNGPSVPPMQAPENDYTSPSSDPGIADMNQQGYVTSDRDRDLSSPGSDSDVEEEIKEAFACGPVSNMISSISETEIDLTSDESSSGRSSHLTNSIEEASSPTSDQELDPDTELDFKRSFYLPVGPRLMPSSDDYDGTSEGESDSDSEDDLSENSDSPWLLSNLVNRLISEGSYPISCPEECLKRKPSMSDTISPSSDIGDGDLADEEVDGTQDIKETKNLPNLYLTNLMEQQARGAEKNVPNRLCKNSREEEVEEPNNDLMMLQQRRELDSPSLTESVISDKDEGRETDPHVPARSSASIERITEVKNSLTLDLPTAQTNRCFSLTYSTDNDEEEEEDGESEEEEEGHPELSSSEDSSPEADMPFSKKFLNVFVNSTTRSSSTESFGLFSCTINGEERDQTHRAVYRFIPRHADELELDVDDPLFVEEEEDDYWYRGYNMRTGERGIFPAFYATEVMGASKELLGMKRNPAWMETFCVQFLGSVEVPYHQGNGILCAAMQKIAMSRKRTVHVRPPSLCELEISLQGVKLIMSLEDEYDSFNEFDRCSHFFQMKNISFCGCHPRNNCYFGFITKHPMLNRFACHVFVSQESMRPVAECVGRAFQEYYQEHLEYACPTEDIYLE